MKHHMPAIRRICLSFLWMLILCSIVMVVLVLLGQQFVNPPLTAIGFALLATIVFELVRWREKRGTMGPNVDGDDC